MYIQSHVSGLFFWRGYTCNNPWGSGTAWTLHPCSSGSCYHLGFQLIKRTNKSCMDVLAIGWSLSWDHELSTEEEKPHKEMLLQLLWCLRRCCYHPCVPGSAFVSPQVVWEQRVLRSLGQGDESPIQSLLHSQDTKTGFSLVVILH